MRKCSNCFQTKPDSEFYAKRSAGPNGRQSRCKACNAEVVAGYKARSSKRHHCCSDCRRKIMNGETPFCRLDSLGCDQCTEVA